MKIQPFIAVSFALMLVFAPQSSTVGDPELKLRQRAYAARLISPRAGDVLAPGQVVRIEWHAVFPDLDISNCETELRLSLDGGRTFTWITGERDPTVQYFDWVVPATPSNNAVLDIHFGCLGYYPETSSIQRQATFVISATRN
jgi:hypothetical protein